MKSKNIIVIFFLALPFLVTHCRKPKKEIDFRKKECQSGTLCFYNPVSGMEVLVDSMQKKCEVYSEYFDKNSTSFRLFFNNSYFSFYFVESSDSFMLNVLDDIELTSSKEKLFEDIGTLKFNDTLQLRGNKKMGVFFKTINGFGLITTSNKATESDSERLISKLIANTSMLKKEKPFKGSISFENKVLGRYVRVDSLNNITSIANFRFGRKKNNANFIRYKDTLWGLMQIYYSTSFNNKPDESYMLKKTYDKHIRNGGLVSNQERSSERILIKEKPHLYFRFIHEQRYILDSRLYYFNDSISICSYTVPFKGKMPIRDSTLFIQETIKLHRKVLSNFWIEDFYE